jgi:hypothetical protein
VGVIEGLNGGALVMVLLLAWSLFKMLVSEDEE